MNLKHTSISSYPMETSCINTSRNCHRGLQNSPNIDLTPDLKDYGMQLLKVSIPRFLLCFMFFMSTKKSCQVLYRDNNNELFTSFVHK